MTKAMTLEPRSNGFQLDPEACGNINGIGRFYSGLGRPMSRSAIVRRALGLLSHHVRQLESDGRPEAVMVEMLAASGHSHLRAATDLRIPVDGDQP